MQVHAGHQTDLALPVGAELDRNLHPADAGAFEATGKVVELNVFKKASIAADDELLPVPGGRDGAAMEVTTSLFEELQRARFREARRLKRVEALELEIRLARVRNDALRAALDVARSSAVALTAEGVAEEGVAEEGVAEEGAAETASVPETDKAEDTAETAPVSMLAQAEEPAETTPVSASAEAEDTSETIPVAVIAEAENTAENLRPRRLGGSLMRLLLSRR